MCVFYEILKRFLFADGDLMLHATKCLLESEKMHLSQLHSIDGVYVIALKRLTLISDHDYNVFSSCSLNALMASKVLIKKVTDRAGSRLNRS